MGVSLPAWQPTVNTQSGLAIATVIGMENFKDNQQIVRRFFDAFNLKDEKIIDEVISNDYVDYGHQPPGRGPSGAKDDYREFVGGFDDARFEIDDLVISGDQAVARWTCSGTHTGDFIGIPATRKKVSIQGISMYRIRDGKIVETRNVADVFGLLVQVGAVSLGGMKAGKAA
jgi:steroid delta-isomerase-like uncharacterized protein